MQCIVSKQDLSKHKDVHTVRQMSSNDHDCQYQIYGADDAVCLMSSAIGRLWLTYPTSLLWIVENAQ
jgi:hypothetical protein